MNPSRIFKYCLFSVILFNFVGVSCSSLECVPKDFGQGSVVCVCNSTYCDTLDPLKLVPKGKYFLVTTSKSGDRFVTSTGDLQVESLGGAVDIEVTVNRNKVYQKIIGFGGAFTDAAAINIASLNTTFQKVIVEQYYGESGLEYNIGRVPMGGSDFSTRPYSYDDVENDTTLSNFGLVEEDLIYKIPLIKQALEVQPNLKLFASVWSAPKWMKTNNAFHGIGSLIPEYYQIWAEYFVKFLEEYAKQNLTFWGITTQNEPLHGKDIDYNFNCMGWSPEKQRNWIKNNLGPTLRSSVFKDIKIIMYDDQRLHLINYTNTILRDPEAAKYIDGIGVHWYMDSFLPPYILETTHYNFPDYFILGTEACAGAMPSSPDVILGSWERAANYASDIINDLNNFVGGWTDWNLALDMQGGPNWAENFVDAPMIIDGDSVYKQPMYYTFGHFSKFILSESVRIQHKLNNETIKELEILTCLRPDNSVVVVLLNRLKESRTVRIKDLDDYGFIEVEVRPNSLSTVVYNVNEPLISTTTDKNGTGGTSCSSISLISVGLYIIAYRSTIAML